MHVVYSGLGEYAEMLIYSSYNGGETWFKAHDQLQANRTNNYYTPALYLISKIDYKRVGLMAKNMLIVYDSTGRIQDNIDKKDYDYNSDKILHVPRDYMNNHSLILESNKRLYFSSGKVMGLWAPVFIKTNETMVIGLHNSILVSKNNGLSWKYYAFENYEAPIRTYEEIPMTLNKENLATIGLQDALLLQGNILVIRYGTSVYTLDVNGL